MSRTGDTGRTTLAGARLALGLLTVLPVGNVVTDRRAVRHALLLAPSWD